MPKRGQFEVIKPRNLPKISSSLWWNCENFLTLMTKIPPVLKDEEEVVLEDNVLHPFSQTELNDLVRDLSLSKDSAELLASRLKGKKNSSLTELASASSASGIKSTFVFSQQWRTWYTVKYCPASAQAWSVTVRTQRLETVHWQQQAITEMCSATQWQSICRYTHRSLDFTEGEVWSGEVCAGENWLWST